MRVSVFAKPGASPIQHTQNTPLQPNTLEIELTGSPSPNAMVMSYAPSSYPSGTSMDRSTVRTSKPSSQIGHQRKSAGLHHGRGTQVECLHSSPAVRPAPPPLPSLWFLCLSTPPRWRRQGVTFKQENTEHCFGWRQSYCAPEFISPAPKRGPDSQTQAQN
jgi:hypothetical protein